MTKHWGYQCIKDECWVHFINSYDTFSIIDSLPNIVYVLMDTKNNIKYVL